MLRQRVLACFKDLHRARLEVFAGDTDTLLGTQQAIRDEFRKHREVSDAAQIEELVKQGEGTAEYLRKYVVQIEHTEDRPDHGKVNIRPSTHMLDNQPYSDPRDDPLYVDPKPRYERRKKKQQTCVQPEEAQN